MLLLDLYINFAFVTQYPWDSAKVIYKQLPRKRLRESNQVTFGLLILKINEKKMQEILKKYSDIGNCPVRNVISHFSTKWGLLILALLGETRCLRFNEILHALPDISPKVLSSTLKTLESDGLVSRKLYPSIPPKVEYSITGKGDSLMPILGDLIRWGLSQLGK